MAEREDDIQAAIFGHLIRVLPEGWLTFHVPNGGWRQKTTAARFRRLGVVAGIPDLVLVGPGGRVAFLEVKTTDGRLSRPQARFHDHCHRFDVPWTIARSIDDARSFLARLGIATREACRD
jgi:VRR-NUC domain